MFSSKQRLPHLLPPDTYYSPEQYQLERTLLINTAWHAIGTTDELSQHGDFITRDLLGHSIQVRNFNGELRALSNICAHRHCLLTSKRCGNTPQMRCQYHGWEYNGEGQVNDIPQSENFEPLPKSPETIPVYRVACCGQVVFVCLSDDAEDLKSYLGDYYTTIEERFGSQTKPFLRFEWDYAANWKVAIENSLESYHIPSVHRFTFREDPGEEHSSHILEPKYTSFSSALPFSPSSKVDSMFQRTENAMMRYLGVSTTNDYSQHHLFPNLLLSFTDAISLVHCVIPTGPNTAKAIIHQFGTIGTSKKGPRYWSALAWGKLKAAITRKIMAEDMQLIPDIQAGLEKSRLTGVLGRNEERLHAFQSFIIDRTSTQPTSQATNSDQ